MKNAKAVKSRVISGGEKDGFGVADYKDESIGGISSKGKACLKSQRGTAE